MVDTKEGIKEVLLSVRAVNGLKQLNSEEKRTAQRYDMSFIKALLVSFIGVRQLKEQGVDSDILKLIKSMLSEYREKTLCANYCLFHLQIFS